MSGIERRSQLVQAPGPEEHHWGECFIAVRDGDTVHTLSGMVRELELEREDEFYFDTNWSPTKVPIDEMTVRVRFKGNVVQEMRPYDGGVK